MFPSLNVLGGPLQACSHEPKTGWFRDGCCNTDASDGGSHTICCRVTPEFLGFLQQRGNDLVTPMPQYDFPGLVDGDQWCVCAASWKQAYEDGTACPVVLESTHQSALSIVTMEMLLTHAVAQVA